MEVGGQSRRSVSAAATARSRWSCVRWAKPSRGARVNVPRRRQRRTRRPAETTPTDVGPRGRHAEHQRDRPASRAASSIARGSSGSSANATGTPGMSGIRLATKKCPGLVSAAAPTAPHDDREGCHHNRPPQEAPPDGRLAVPGGEHVGEAQSDECEGGGHPAHRAAVRPCVEAGNGDRQSDRDRDRNGGIGPLRLRESRPGGQSQRRSPA